MPDLDPPVAGPTPSTGDVQDDRSNPVEEIPQRVVLVHGIRTNGVQSIYRLEHWLARLNQYEIHRADLPIRRAIEVRWTVDRDVAALAKMVQPGDVVIGHSYGGCLAFKVAQLVALRAVFLFNAALDANVDMSRMVGRPPVWNIYSRGDRAVWLAGFLPWHIFGRAGYSGLSDLSNDHNIEVGGGHSDAMVGQGAERWADFIHERLLDLRGSLNG